MAFDLPFCHQNTHANVVTVLVVDDDPIFLSIISNMLKNPSYKDKSFGEIIVMTANDSSEAVATLRGQWNKIDVVITDYHMPGLNGVQLKKRIDQEFGILPVIVISADMSDEIEQETLSSGAMGFMRKPIKPNDLNTVWKHLNYKLNDGSKKIQKTSSSSSQSDGDSGPQAGTKCKITWTRSLEDLFFKAIQHIGVHKATPKKILEFMNVDYLTRAHVASKLQKYRQLLKRVKDEAIKRRRAMNSHLTSSSYVNPQQYSYNNIGLSNNSIFNSQRGYGLGQSSLMMNNNVGLHDSVNYMNRRPTYDLSQTGPKLLPIKQEGGSTFGTSQVYQDPMFAEFGTTSDVLGMNSNLSTGTMGSNYAGIKINKNGNLVGLGGIRVNGTGSGSLGGIRANGTENGNGYLGGIRAHGTGNGNEFLGGIRVHGDGIGDDSLGGIRVDGIGNGNGNGTRVNGNGYGYGNGSRVNGTGNGNGSLGGIGVDGIGNGNGNGYVGENLGGMNWNFSNNNMSNHEIQSQNNLIAQTNGVAPVSKNPSIFSDHHDINKHESKMTTENLGMSTDLLEKNAVLGAYPLEDNGNNNEETSNSFDANSAMYFPTHDMNSTNQEHGDADLADLLLTFDQGWSNEDLMNYLLSDDMN